MAENVYRYHLIKKDPDGDYLKKAESELSLISIMNIDDTNFMIAASNPAQPTSIELKRQGAMLNLYIRTQRVPNNRGGKNLEPSLEDVLKKLEISF